MPPILELDGIGKRFGGLEALRGIRLEVAAGALVALIGPNGAGKTTLFDVVTGLARPTTGRVRLAGADVTRLPPHRIARLGVARTFQIARLFPSLPALDNVLVGVTFARREPLRAAARRREAERLLEVVGLAASARSPAGRLSLGEQKRLELACALAPAPHLLLLDELGAGLPPGARAELRVLYGRLREQGLTVVAIEHGAAGLTAIADRVIVLDRGEIVADGRPADVFASPRLAAAYLGKADEP